MKTFIITATAIISLLILTPRLYSTALDDYVAAPDPSYTYQLSESRPGFGYNAYIIRMTSQTWQSQAEVDQPLWQHWLSIIVPSNVAHSSALLTVYGGATDDPAPSTGFTDAEVILATQTDSVVASIYAIPNQPLVFTDDPGYKVEDEIIAYSWDKYLTSSEPDWPAQLPMTKAVIRAMDTVQDFLGGAGFEGINIDTFVVGGASKRGWVSWLAAAVDSRVIGAAPMVIDLLNMPASFRHHHAAYGFWAPAISDYESYDIFSWFGTPQMDILLEMVDPYLYRDRFADKPVFMINSAGDQFFLPDSAQFYFHDLPGQKNLSYMPNTGHSLSGAETEVATRLLAYYLAAAEGNPIPQFSWTKNTDGSITVNTVDTPSSVKLWQAHNPAARDFRQMTIGNAWTSSDLAPESPGTYNAALPTPEQGYSAFFVELTFPGNFTFTTEISIIPDYMPYLADYNYDGTLNAKDLPHFAASWLAGGCDVQNYYCQGTDIDKSEQTDLSDYAAFFNYWLNR
jgi:PhoPQ-activated pathogenicity-related protein